MVEDVYFKIKAGLQISAELHSDGQQSPISIIVTAYPGSIKLTSTSTLETIDEIDNALGRKKLNESDGLKDP